MNKSKEKLKQLTKRYPFINDSTRTYEYRIEAQNQAPEDILTLFIKMDRQQLPEYFRSDKEAYWRCSRKLIADDFVSKVLAERASEEQKLDENTQNQAVFYYSKHCHACKKFGPYFEELARKKIVHDAMENTGRWNESEMGTNHLKNISFNRINNSLNSIPETQNFGYTPVFVMYRAGLKDQPIILHPLFITPDILEDFFTITTQYKILGDQVVKDLFSAERIKERSVEDGIFKF